jgi:hypothetical protein
MSSQFDDIEKRARALSREEKAALARVLIDELDPVNEPGVEELWLDRVIWVQTCADPTLSIQPHLRRRE